MIILLPQFSLGFAIRQPANQSLKVFHPLRPDVRTVDLTEFYDKDPHTNIAKSIVAYGESHMDRSPCGTGTTAGMTRLRHQDKLAAGQPYANAGPLGMFFEGRIVRQMKIGEFNGVLDPVRGNAQITGYHQFVLDSGDPFPERFLL